MIRKNFGRFILVIVCVQFFVGSEGLDRQACKGPQINNCATDRLQCEIGEHIDIKYRFYVFVNTYRTCSTINCPIQPWHACSFDLSICRISFSAADRLKLDDQCNGKRNCNLLSPILNSTYCNTTTTRSVCFNGYQQNGYLIIYDCEQVSSTISSEQPYVESTTPEVKKVSVTTTLFSNILFHSSTPAFKSTLKNDKEASRRGKDTSETSMIIGSVVGSFLLMVLVIIIVIIIVRRKKSDVARSTGVSNPGYETPSLRNNTRENSQFTTNEYTLLHGVQRNNFHGVGGNYNHAMSNADDHARIITHDDFTHPYDNNDSNRGVRQGGILVNDDFNHIGNNNHSDGQRESTRIPVQDDGNYNHIGDNESEIVNRKNYNHIGESGCDSGAHYEL
ncbi:probable serine/threonine-protein kinase DDB_G0283337 [Patella vulgata]|uniref:probable serine/threonine-protein kinase DDB_G0283337 n=1 Tax=Patella vulgata TaxID=6465 RepID=UPI00218009A1|nr:probable serine/threonine-protein kinase DDB_G0283337 [Patella vulgata]XP_050393428.1 probable serine/threonine-protein kinase DDB_G0283337 [Patella vulgata]